jgi:peptidoglycan/LPS O-acetylase OafA/YrhL
LCFYWRHAVRSARPNLGRAIRTAASQGPFAARRICRIWLPFAVAIVIAAICCDLVDTRPDPQAWNVWSPDLPNLDNTVGTLAMLGQGKDALLDIPVWSLTHELRISLIVPVLVFAQRRHSLETTIAAFALLGIVAFLFGSMWQNIEPLYGKTSQGSFEVTAYYVWFFCLGIATALHRDAVLAFAARHRVALGILCLAFLSGRWPSQMVTDVSYGLGAMLLMWLVMVSPLVSRLMMTPVLQWLGRISYSLYLTHLIVLLTMYYTVRGLMPPQIISLFLGVPIALVVAHLFTRFVDAPSIRLSRQVARRISQWRDSRRVQSKNGTGTPAA